MCVKYELDIEHQFILPDHELDLPYGVSFLSLHLVKKCIPPSGALGCTSFSWSDPLPIESESLFRQR